jgi:signal transduction histidine kinase
MIGLKRALWGIGLAGLAVGAVTIFLVAASDHEPSKVPTLILGPFVGWSFIGVGLYAWWRRPDNRVGALMTAVGFAFALGALFEANDPLLYTLGVVLSGFYAAVIVHMLLAFPTGRLEGRWSRRLVGAAYVLVVAVPIGVSLVREGCDCGVTNTPDNLLFISRHETLAAAIDGVGNVLAVLVTLAVAVILFRRWRRASKVQRRSLAPVLWTGALFALGLGLSAVGDIADGHNGANAVNGPGMVCFILLPYSFLVGLLRSRYSRAGAVGQLVVRLQGNSSSLRDALAEALGDASLRLLYRRPGREAWVDHDGRPVALPEAGVTLLERDGEPIGAIVHDPALDEEPQLLQSAASAASLALDNERLAAELHARVDELEDSRRRSIVAAMGERRRLERDLHDGAQQRLVALSLQLGLARGQVERDPEAAGRMLDSAREELRSALEELRELARGIHPAILTDRGLDAALESLVDRSPLPVAVDEIPGERLPVAVEAAAYFVVAESLTNVAKYAGAHEAHVRVARHGGTAVVEVRDDGVGGADATGGTGLRGLADRLAALDGSLEVLSPPGGGTVVRATIPCAQ